MPDWLYHLPVAWMGLVVCAATALVAAGVYGAAIALAARGRAPMLKAMKDRAIADLVTGQMRRRPRGRLDRERVRAERGVLRAFGL